MLIGTSLNPKVLSLIVAAIAPGVTLVVARVDRYQQPPGTAPPRLAAPGRAAGGRTGATSPLPAGPILRA
ncbi:hypothetical protein [Oerskovia enterophila]|uniref:hypothetical protein n=1 Tax=Oerskovia enterophila TaxID=43678 RepID=UPI001470F742|nr:hypothetical protein [Oerskovia enterophila]